MSWVAFVTVEVKFEKVERGFFFVFVFVDGHFLLHLSLLIFLIFSFFFFVLYMYCRSSRGGERRGFKNNENSIMIHHLAKQRFVNIEIQTLAPKEIKGVC